jgi:hypothetical protein
MTRTGLIRIFCVAAPVAACLAVFLCLDPIPQDPAYHDFADGRGRFGIPFFNDVFSNAALLLGGLSGLLFMARHSSMSRRRPFRERRESLSYSVLFLGLFLTGIGSGYYHLSPDTARLFWDRLPMTLVFMPLTAIVITERIDFRTGRALLWPLVLVGASSVIFWRFGELLGKGDLRFYGMVQFCPMVTLPLILLIYPPQYTHAGYFWRVLLWYGLAKVFELLDEPVFELTRVVSGHSIKHICAALAVWSLVAMLKRRSPAAAT